MNHVESVVDVVIEAMKTIKCQRYYCTERGYQAELYCALREKSKDILSSDIIPESEYQKRMGTHGTTQRPDIILHVPSQFSGLCVNEGNHLVIALKRKARECGAIKDFSKMDEMFEKLNYAVGIFINIDAVDTCLALYSGPYRERMHAISVKFTDSTVSIKHEFYNRGILSSDHKSKIIE